MKMWKSNKLTGEWDLANDEIAKRFIESEYYKNAELRRCRGTSMNLVLFITGKDGLNSTWDWDEKKGSIEGSPDMMQILDIVGRKEKPIS